MSGGSFGFLYSADADDLLCGETRINDVLSMAKALEEHGYPKSAYKTLQIAELVEQKKALEKQINDLLLSTSGDSQTWQVWREVEMAVSNDSSWTTAAEILQGFEDGLN